MAGEKRAFFSSSSEPQNNNFLTLETLQSETEVSFSQPLFCHFYMSGNNWENTKQKFGFALKIAKHTETHIEHHFPAGWWVLCIVTAFFFELCYGGRTERWVPKRLLGAWNGSWMKCRQWSPTKWSRKDLHQGVVTPTDTNAPKTLSWSASDAFQRLVVVPSSHPDPLVSWGQGTMCPQLSSASVTVPAQHTELIPRSSRCGMCRSQPGMRCSPASAHLPGHHSWGFCCSWMPLTQHLLSFEICSHGRKHCQGWQDWGASLQP